LVVFLSERSLFFLPGEAFFTLPGKLLSASGQENGCACTMTYSGSGRGTSTLNLQSGLFFVLSDGGEGAPFQSFPQKG
jgi:hypothetical protein